MDAKNSIHLGTENGGIVIDFDRLMGASFVVRDEACRHQATLYVVLAVDAG